MFSAYKSLSKTTPDYQTRVALLRSLVAARVAAPNPTLALIQ